MKTIHKYTLADNPTSQTQLVEMPEGAEILTAQIQFGEICLWAKVDTERSNTGRLIAIRATDQMIKSASIIETYIATVQHGAFVWHIFELSA